jgi:hypothetical protein
MAWTITPEMKSFFKSITSVKSVHGGLSNYPDSPISNIFDFFYLSLLVGLHQNQKGEINDNNGHNEDENNIDNSKSTILKTEGIPDNVSSSFKKYINAIYISKEIVNEKVNIDARSEILRFIEDRYPIDPDTKEVKMSKKTIEDLNAYAIGGFKFMKKSIEKPSDLLIFFENYFKLLR